MREPLRDVWDVDAVLPQEWFWDHDIHIFPTVNKEPAVPKGTSQFDYRCTRIQASRFREYGAPGGVRDGHDDGLTVVDADSAKTKVLVTEVLPETPFTVTTGPCHDGSDGFGLHSYYRTRGPLPSSIRRDGLSIENKNQGLYVVGPGSVRPDGVVYRVSDWSWCWADIPFFPEPFVFDDGSCGTFSTPGQPLVLPAKVIEQERHKTLHKMMRSLAARCVPLDGALAACLIENEARCHPPLKADEKLDRFLRRAYRQKDRGDFVRTPEAGWTLAGALLETGFSVDATLAAVRSITPDFDPETSA